MDKLRIGGMTPLSATDYPGRLAAVVFCQGCPWRCGYCHNPHLIPPRSTSEIVWDDVRNFLQRRIGLLDAVVFSGGEPALQQGIAEAMQEARDLGFLVGLHTAGIYPARLKELLPLLDWVGMDIKAPFSGYEKITGVPGSGAPAKECAQLVIESGVAHEFRTTVHPQLLGREVLIEMAQTLAGMGAQHYALQQFRAQGCVDENLCADSAIHAWDDDAGEHIRPLFQDFSMRHA